MTLRWPACSREQPPGIHSNDPAITLNVVSFQAKDKRYMHVSVSHLARFSHWLAITPRRVSDRIRITCPTQTITSHPNFNSNNHLFYRRLKTCTHTPEQCTGCSFHVCTITVMCVHCKCCLCQFRRATLITKHHFPQTTSSQRCITRQHKQLLHSQRYLDGI